MWLLHKRMDIPERNVTDDTQELLRALAYKGEVSGDEIAAQIGWPPERMRAVVLGHLDLFDVWAFEDGQGDIDRLQLSADGYYFARRLVRAGRSEAEPAT